SYSGVTARTNSAISTRQVRSAYCWATLGLNLRLRQSDRQSANDAGDTRFGEFCADPAALVALDVADGEDKRTGGHAPPRAAVGVVVAGPADFAVGVTGHVEHQRAVDDPVRQAVGDVAGGHWLARRPRTRDLAGERVPRDR